VIGNRYDPTRPEMQKMLSDLVPNSSCLDDLDDGVIQWGLLPGLVNIQKNYGKSPFLMGKTW